MWVSHTWGTSPEERSMAFPCDRYVDSSDAAYYRGVAVRAPAWAVFRWLCQLRVAPYSHDWIDNLGRRSPQGLIPGLERLVIGQRFLSGFELVDFEYDRSLTVRVGSNSMDSKIFGELAISYLLLPQGVDHCKLLAKLIARFHRGPLGWSMRALLPWGDLIMMRRQLLNLKVLAEEPAHTS